LKLGPSTVHDYVQTAISGHWIYNEDPMPAKGKRLKLHATSRTAVTAGILPWPATLQDRMRKHTA
jgi:hypothetical protein